MNIGFTKPNNYDGKSSWTDYQVHFETVSKLNQWTDEIKALKLISCMQDSALSTIGEIDTNKPDCLLLLPEHLDMPASQVV
jgi:hypothetical protein